MAQLAHEGYDPSFGARPLKRVIQREISDRLGAADPRRQGGRRRHRHRRLDVDGRITVSV